MKDRKNRLYQPIEILVQELAHSTLVSMNTVGEEYTLEEFKKLFDKGNTRSFLETLSFLSIDPRVINSSLRIDYDRYVDHLFEIYSTELKNHPISISPTIQRRKYKFDLNSLLIDS